MSGPHPPPPNTLDALRERVLRAGLAVLAVGMPMTAILVIVQGALEHQLNLITNYEKENADIVRHTPSILPVPAEQFVLHTKKSVEPGRYSQRTTALPNSDRELKSLLLIVTLWRGPAPSGSAV